MPEERYGCAGVVRSQPGWLGGTEENRQRGNTGEGRAEDREKNGQKRVRERRKEEGKGKMLDGMRSPSMRGWTKQVLGSPTMYMEPS